jgi:hypothetical protein
MPPSGVYSSDYPAEYTQYDSQYAGRKEAIGWKWWDTQTFTSASTTALPGYFTVVRATPDLGNMEVAGQLAAPKAFLLRAIRCFFKIRPHNITQAATTAVQTGMIDDVAQIANTGVLSLTIGSKVYCQEPVYCLSSGAGIWGVASVAGANAANLYSDYAQLGIPDPRAVNTLAKPIFIAPQINWKVDIVWAATITLAGGNPALTVILDGDLIRPVQ